MEYRIGIIDDDRAKITQLLIFTAQGWSDDNGNLVKEKYKDVSLVPNEIQLDSDINQMVEKVVADKPDALIIDFKLSSQENISYSGVSLAQAIDQRLRGFPIFILTSYEDDLYEKENFDAYQVFDFERYINDLQERLEINSKIVQQIKKYNTTLNQWKTELISLLPRAGESAAIDERILLLDSFIENSIDGTSALPQRLKQELDDTNRIQLLIDKIDKIIGAE